MSGGSGCACDSGGPEQGKTGSDGEVLTGPVVVQRYARWRGRRCVSGDGAADGDVEGPFRSRDGKEGEDDGDHGDVRRWSRGGSPRSKSRGGRGDGGARRRGGHRARERRGAEESGRGGAGAGWWRATALGSGGGLGPSAPIQTGKGREACGRERVGGGEWVAARVRPSGERGLCRGRVGRPGVGWPTGPAGWLAGSVGPGVWGVSFSFFC